MAAEEAALRTLLAQPHDADGHAVLLKRVTALSGDVGKLQDSLDSISVGELEGEARDAAKARRKAVNAVLEATLMPGIASLRTVAVKA